MSRPARHPESHKSNGFEDPLSNYEAPAYADDMERKLAEESVATVRTEPVTTVTPETTVVETMQLMADVHVRCALVVDEGSLVGIFTERDVLSKVADNFHDVKDQPVKSFMTPDPIVAYETDNVAVALCALATGGIRHVPVLDVDHRIVGVVSPQRLMLFLQEQFR